MSDVKTSTPGASQGEQPGAAPQAPGVNFDAVYARHARHLSPAFVKALTLAGYGRLFVRAEGTRLYDEAGAEYLDMLSGCGAVALGYNHPELIAAAEASLRAQRPSFVQVSPGIEHGLLAEALAARLPAELSMSFFCNSGSEAVENALKLAFRATRRAGVVYCHNAYHGLTLGALSVMGSERLRGAFPTLPGNEMVPFGDLEAAERLLASKRFAAFIVEPIQFEGGILFAPPAYFRELAALCRRYGSALIFDEVQTGIGRTGTLFAFEWLGVVPDVVCFAKALTGGLVPIGGYATSPEWHKRAYRWDTELQANTTGGGTLACAVARRTLELVDDALLAHVRALGEHLGARLDAIAAQRKVVRHMRGRGLMWAVQLVPPPAGAQRIVNALTLGVPHEVARRLLAQWVALRLLERGFMTQIPSHDPTVLRVEPALIMTRAEIDRFADALDEVLAESESFQRFVRDFGKRLLGRAFQEAS